ncbi:pentatricopeptide repeat-containing protein At5g56310-like [Wolffia australiana]
MPLTHDPIPWNTMIAGYGRIGDARRAIQLFRRAPARNLVSWTAAIAACTNSSEHAQALALFLEMERTACFVLDVVILVSVLKACANLGELGLGRRLHRLAGGLRSARLAAALVDMYVKCGCLDEAARVFDAAGGAGRDVVLYNAMINGLALHGRGAQALRLFHEMKAAGAAPNESTFVAVLRACSHAGLVEEGRAAFAAMDELGVERRREHYGCFADMLSRAGLVEEAEEVVRTMPMAAEAAQWGAVMAGCRAHGDGAVAARVGRRLVAMEPQDGGRYVIMANTLAESGRWEDAGQARADMESNRARKEAGKSSLEPMF